MADVEFDDVNMKGVKFDDVNMKSVEIHDINMSDIKITAVQLGGAHFKHIGLPPGSNGKQRPLHFEEAYLPGTTFLKCDLSDVRIFECNVEGMEIDGVPVANLLVGKN